MAVVFWATCGHLFIVRSSLTKLAASLILFPDC